MILSFMTPHHWRGDVFVGPQLRHCTELQNTDRENNKHVKFILNDLYKDFSVDSHAVDHSAADDAGNK